MSYKVTRDANGLPSVTLTDEPPYCHAFGETGPAHGPELDTGSWLVMAFPVWSMPDTAAVQVALDAAKHFGGKLNLGLRPYDDPDEVGAWHPALEDDGHSPLWVLLEDGVVRMKRTGIPDTSELIEAISAASYLG